ncbi:Hydroxypyruvate isomerase [compost metagenome]
MARQDLDLPTCIAALAGHIGHVQFADCPGRAAPGTGAVDFVAARQALAASGYVGWLGAEYRPGGEGTAASLGWLAEWRSW